ncbi:hypothetical protein PENSPDRAFT_625749 [Peniophora sp. CONT]|nr:hypothetical protein PENSPDRAFT_625749 [Peniophora sp. CONT]
MVYRSLSLVVSVFAAVSFVQGQSNDSQTSLTLDQTVLSTAFEHENAGGPNNFTPSTTSSNNFINWCETTGLPLTNGTQVKTGSCNPAPMGAIPSQDKIPTSKFSSPTNFAELCQNTTFTITLEIANLASGWSADVFQNFYAAPQQLEADTGLIRGHAHFYIDPIQAYNSTTPVDPLGFVFAGLASAKAVDGKLSSNVTGGLPVGVYRLASVIASENHQPVLAPLAAHASIDDII